MHIIIIGNPVDGFQFIGPFKTLDDAIEWESNVAIGADWWVAPIETTRAYEKMAMYDDQGNLVAN